MAAYGLYTHIASNKFRSVLLLVGLFLLAYVLVFAIALLVEAVSAPESADYTGLAGRDLIKAFPYATLGICGWIAIAYFYHQRMIDALTGGEAVTWRQQPRLYDLLENLCISRGLQVPKLKVMPSEALNAFATGLNQKQYAITVTTGLLKELNDQELEAVLGHELTHIRNGDVQLMVIAMVIAGLIGFIAETFFRMVFDGDWTLSSSSDSKNPIADFVIMLLVMLLAALLIALAWLLSQTLRLALSRSREFLADAGSVELTKNPDAMISALRKIENRGELPGATSAVMEMCLDNPRSGFADLFATHPSIDDRIAALIAFAGGHDPGPRPLSAEPAGSLPGLAVAPAKPLLGAAAALTAPLRHGAALAEEVAEARRRCAAGSSRPSQPD